MELIIQPLWEEDHSTSVLLNNTVALGINIFIVLLLLLLLLLLFVTTTAIKCRGLKYVTHILVLYMNLLTKTTVVRVQAMKAQRKSRYKSLLVLNLGGKWG